MVTKKQIALRHVLVSDVACFFEHSRQPEAVRVAMPARDVDDRTAFDEMWSRILDDRKFACRTILVGLDVAGYIAQFEQMGAPSLSYWLGREFWHRGVASMALEMFLDEVCIRPLYARVASGNGASLRILERQGFRIVGWDRYHSPPNNCDTAEAILRLD